jgi:transcriptional regulator with XRE-family HTH domain
MEIGQRLRAIREAKNLSQVEVARATGFVQPYISRGENGVMTPNVESLEKWARALDMTLYQLLYDGEEPPKPVKKSDAKLWGQPAREAVKLERLRKALAKMDAEDRELLLTMTSYMASRSRAK